MIYLFSILTIVAFLIGTRLSRILKISFLNPFILALFLILAVLFFGNISYDDYYQGNQPLNNLLSLSIVALALPFYEQLQQIRHKWKEFLLICTLGSILAMVSGILFSLWFGGDAEIVASVAGKSVTTPIALLISQDLGGDPVLTSVGVILAGMLGAMIGLPLLRLIRVQDVQAQGIAMGAVSHALGTARCMELDRELGSYSSIAFAVCGIISSLLAPMIYRIIMLLAS